MVKSRKRINPRRKTPTPKTPRPRRPTDLTLRNLRAERKRLDEITLALTEYRDSLRMDLNALDARVRNLEAAQPTPAPETGTLL
jgi:hypothetical protein